MNVKTKKIIAREGLVFLGILILSVFTGYRAYEFFWVHISSRVDNSVYFLYPARTLRGAILKNILSFYIIYLCIWLIIFIIRFIIWAIKTLKNRG